MVAASHILLGLLDDAVAIGCLHHVMLLDVIGVSASQALDQVWVSRSKIIRLSRVDTQVVNVPLLIAKRRQVTR